MLIVRLLMSVCAAGLFLAGVAVFAVSLGGDEAGYYTSPVYTVRTATTAVTSDRLDLAPEPTSWWPFALGSVRINLRSLDGRPIFLGIGPSAAVAQYLAGVPHADVVAVDGAGGELVLRPVGGNALPTSPASQAFWDLHATTTDAQTVTWEARQGDWTVVIMDAEGLPGLAVSVSLGIRMSGFVWVGVAAMLAGLLLGIAALLAFRRRSETITRGSRLGPSGEAA